MRNDVIGYHSYDGTGLTEEILASMEGLIEISITIDSTCRDTANATTTDLRRGLVLWPDTAVTNDNYTQFDAAAKSAGAGGQAVVLAHPVDISAGVNIVAKAYKGCVLKPDKLIDDSGYTLTHFDATEQAKAKGIIVMDKSTNIP